MNNLVKFPSIIFIENVEKNVSVNSRYMFPRYNINVIVKDTYEVFNHENILHSLNINIVNLDIESIDIDVIKLTSKNNTDWWSYVYLWSLQSAERLFPKWLNEYKNLSFEDLKGI